MPTSTAVSQNDNSKEAVAKRSWLVLIGGLLLSGAVLGQTASPMLSTGGGGSGGTGSGGGSTPYATTYFENGGLTRAGESVQPLGTDLMGDQINPYDGSLSFSHTDVSLPGNNALAVSVGRKIGTGKTGTFFYTNSGYFGDWELEIPLPRPRPFRKFHELKVEDFLKNLPAKWRKVGRL